MTNTPLISKAQTSSTASRMIIYVRQHADLRMLACAFVLFATFTILFTAVQFATPALAGNDGYYHIKMAQLIREYGLRVPFIWMPMSIIGFDTFYDHHMLYHAYLALFAGGSSAEALTLGAKIASVVLPSLAFLAIWWLLHGQRVRWASIWALGLFALSEAFLYRMSMPRAQSASLLVLVLGLHLLLQRRYKLLLPLGFFYVWLYDGFPLLIALAGVYFASTLIVERRLAWKALVYPAIGIGLGLLINPYFPQNIAFIVSHVLPKMGEATTSVGNEWYPYETWTLIENSGFALAVFVLGVLALGWNDRRIDRPTLTAFVLSITFGFLLFKSRRFVEYFPAFTLIFAALSTAPILERIRWQRLLPIAFIAVLIVPLTITLTQTREAMARSKPADQYAAASTWLKDNAERGTLVFQTDWDDFTRLFFYNTSNVYTVGLDPTYMELYDARLYDEWVQITRGRVEQPSETIRSLFGGAYVFSDLKHERFLERAEDDAGLRKVYRDEYAVIFEVVD